MNRRIVFAWLAVWVFLFAYETLLHGVALEQTYRGLSGLFRSPEEGVTLFPILVLAHLVTAGGLVLVLSVYVRPASLMQAAMFGAVLALAFGVGPTLLQYVSMPLPESLVAIWIAIGIVEFAAAATLARLVLGSPSSARTDA